MQVTQTDTNSCKRVGVEEHLIKFKPSPNFKNMKKFIKSRSETITMGTPLSGAPGAPDLPPQPNQFNLENERISAGQKPEVQPPLPLEPLPPDYIPNVQVKQEVIDTEYEINQPAPIQENQPRDQENNPDPTNTDHSTAICRDFIRGTCKREGTCKYAHRHDLSQLEGVYTFCRKFQNSVCSFENCKYVHASVFEEQQFYRTGFLPDHALHHTGNSNTVQPPPPPLPKEPSAMPLNVDFSNPPPTCCNELEKPMISCIPASSMEARGYYMGDIQNQMATPSRSPVKRTWSNMEAFTARPCDLACNENELPKKCIFCDITEYRLEHCEKKHKKMLQSKEQRSKKMSLLDKQSKKLQSLISELLRPATSAPTPRTAQTNRNISGDKDKALLDALNSFFSANSRLSFGEKK